MEEAHANLLVRLRESSDNENRGCIRVGFMTRSGKRGIVPLEDLVVLVDKPAKEWRSYLKFDKGWPTKLNVIGKKWRRGRLLCKVPAGVLDGVIYFGTTDLRWKARKKGNKGRSIMTPVPVGTPGSRSLGTRHDLMEKDIRLPAAFNPGKHRGQILTLTLAERMYRKDVRDDESWQVTGHNSLDIPRPLVVACPPYRRFKLREEDPKTAVKVANRVVNQLGRGFEIQDERGASVLLHVLKCANEGVWTGDVVGTESAPFTGVYRYIEGVGIRGHHQAAKDVKVDCGTIEINGKHFLAEGKTYEDPTDNINKMLHKFFVLPKGLDVRVVPTVGEEWTHVREGQPLFQPEGVEMGTWSPEEIVALSQYRELCYLAALGTVHDQGKVAYADIDLVSGNSVVVDLDTAPAVQLVRTLEGLIYSSSGIRANLGRFDVEADFEEWRRKKKTQHLKPQKG